MFLKKIYRRIVDDFKQKELLSVKILFFVHTSTLYVLYPFLTIHMRELGINVEETAIMSAITPVVTIIMPPLAGMVADRIGNFKVLLSIFSALGGGAALLLLLVPVGRVRISYPVQTVIGVHCLGHVTNMTIPLGQECSPLNNSTLQMEHQLATCGYVCLTSSEFEAHHQPTSYTIIHADFNHTLAFRMPREPHSQSIDHDKHHSMPPQEDLPVLVRRLGPERLYFPGPASVAPEAKHIPLKWTKKDESWLGYTSEFSRNSSCTQHGLAYEDLPLTGDVATVLTGGVAFEECQPLCLATVKRTTLCSNPFIVIEKDVSLTFWLYLIIRVFIGIIGGTAFAMFEGAVIAILREHSGDYGLQRIYATIGGMISSPLSGLLIDYASRGLDYVDFRPAFYLYAALKLLSGLIMLTINLEFKAPSKDIVNDVMSVIRNFELCALFIVCFILGSAWGYIETFLFLLLQDLGASRSLMGITITIGGIAGIPLLILSGPIIDRIGHANVLFIGFIFYAIRLFGYSMIYNPWHCLFFEAMESVTSSLSFTAAVTYAAKLSTTNTDSSIQGLIGGLYYGVGRGFGSLTGGYLMKWIGTRSTYQVFSMLSLVTGIVYLGFNRFFLMKRAAIRVAHEKEEEFKKSHPESKKENDIALVEKGEKQEKSHDNKAFDNSDKEIEGIKMEKDKVNECKQRKVEAYSNPDMNSQNPDAC